MAVAVGAVGAARCRCGRPRRARQGEKRGCCTRARPADRPSLQPCHRPCMPPSRQTGAPFLKLPAPQRAPSSSCMSTSTRVGPQASATAWALGVDATSQPLGSPTRPTRQRCSWCQTRTSWRAVNRWAGEPCCQAGRAQPLAGRAAAARAPAARQLSPHLQRGLQRGPRVLGLALGRAGQVQDAPAVAWGAGRAHGAGEQWVHGKRQLRALGWQSLRAQQHEARRSSSGGGTSGCTRRAAPSCCRRASASSAEGSELAYGCATSSSGGTVWPAPQAMSSRGTSPRSALWACSVN